MNELLTPKEIAEMQEMDKIWNNPHKLWEEMLDATRAFVSSPFYPAETHEAWVKHEQFLLENVDCSSVDAMRNLRTLNLI